MTKDIQNVNKKWKTKISGIMKACEKDKSFLETENTFIWYAYLFINFTTTKHCSQQYQRKCWEKMAKKWANHLNYANTAAMNPSLSRQEYLVNYSQADDSKFST